MVTRVPPPGSPGSSRQRAPELAADPGLVVEDVETGWVGAVLRTEKSGGVHLVVLEDRHGKVRSFPLGPGFWVDGAPVRLVPPRAIRAGAAQAHGERLGGRARRTGPAPPGRPGSSSRGGTTPSWSRRCGVTTCASRASSWRCSTAWTTSRPPSGPSRPDRGDVSACSSTTSWRGARNGTKPRAWPASPALREHVLVAGHPYVDIWQAVRPARLGLGRWPEVPRGRPWKEGVLAALGWPHATAADVAAGWRRILAAVDSYADLEPALLGRVEELIDFVTGDRVDR